MKVAGFIKTYKITQETTKMGEDSQVAVLPLVVVCVHGEIEASEAKTIVFCSFLIIYNKIRSFYFAVLLKTCNFASDIKRIG